MAPILSLPPTHPSSPTGGILSPQHALWSLGLRPFYLGAAIFSAIVMLLWIAAYVGNLHSHLDHPYWHAHEMIFGYAFAVVVGFLFAAVRNWTGYPTPRRGALMAIFGLWLAARILLPFSPSLSLGADLAFAVAAALGIARSLWQAKNYRNAFFVALLLGIGGANLLFHLGIAGRLGFPIGKSLHLALDLILIIMAVMGGRVIPMFTARGLNRNNIGAPRWLMRLAITLLPLLALATALDAPPLLQATLALLACLTHGACLLHWQPWQTRHTPLLWVLHAAYAWIPLHLGLRAAAALGQVPDSLAVHALTVGALGTLTLGMMTRTTRGHTGQPLRVGRLEVAIYGLIQAAAAVRVLLPGLIPATYTAAITLSGLLWTAAFVLFVAGYWAFLVKSDAYP
ncbi:MAG: NnrS family protein [Proteobacteria bacterium]|nr:NnrS family protein [Pseudomonadota bacterium]HQR04029.1 NnrS family protein [Rhodocyclaceae bacterium]